MSDMSKQAEVHELRGSGDGSDTPSSPDGDAMKHGTANDQADMMRLGKQQQLKVWPTQMNLCNRSVD